MAQGIPNIETALKESSEFSQYDDILNRLLQRLYQSNPETETLSTPDRLGLRNIRTLCDKLECVDGIVRASNE